MAYASSASQKVHVQSLVPKAPMVRDRNWVRKALPDRFIIQPMVMGGNERRRDLSKGGGSLGHWVIPLKDVSHLLFHTFSFCFLDAMK